MNEQKPKSQSFTVTTYTIKKLTPTTVSIVLSHRVPYSPDTKIDVNLLITNNVYMTLLRNMGKGKFNDELPLVFSIDSKGRAYQVLPLELYRQQENSMPARSPVVGKPITLKQS